MGVYDRWGNLMFLKENILAGDKTQGWDGKFQGSIVSPGVYVYKIEYESLEGTLEFLVGDLTVIK